MTETPSALIQYAQTYRCWREKLATNDAATVELFADNPALVSLQAWLDSAQETHRVNMQDKTATGLLSHLADSWGWTTDANEISDSYWVTHGTTGSSRETGQLIDAQLGEAIAGGNPDLHRFTRMLLEFTSQHWVLIAAQTPLWHRGNTVYTYVDLLAYDCSSKRVLVLEIKTGFDSNYDEPLTDNHLEFDVFVDTHRTRHQQQLCWMLTVLREELPGINVAGCVLRVSDELGVRQPEWGDESIERFFKETYIDNDRAYQRRQIKK